MPRVIETARPSTNWTISGIAMRVAIWSSASTSGVPVRVAASAVRSSSTRSPEHVRHTRSSASTIPSPAVMERVRSSATVGNSARMRDSWRAIAWLRRQSLTMCPATPPLMTRTMTTIGENPR
ncbi:Uncharacterised protein [Mycobacteroides abscessus subsp. abscessus]|nr:Uncharacterised protein [Mycobacteroides abscessus subsp. abscessus]